MQGFKTAILPELKNCQNGTFELVFKIQIFLGLKTSKHYEDNNLLKISLTCPKVHQIQDLGQSEYKTGIFSKRTHKISKIIFNLGAKNQYCYEYLARLESKIIVKKQYRSRQI
jgi:hypothetical protein